MHGASASAEAGFLSAVEEVTTRAAREPLAALFREVTPPAASWGIEIDGVTSGRLPDFGCTTTTEVALPPKLAGAPSLRLLRALVGPEATDGRWFFEVDLGSGGTDFHSFARLSPSFRERSGFVAHTGAHAPLSLTRIASSVAAFSRAAPAEARFSDVGVVVRGDAAQVRLGVLAPDAVFRSLFELTSVAPELRAAFEALAPRFVTPSRCTLQAAFAASGASAVCSGIEIATPGDAGGWEPLISELVRHGWVDAAIGRAALAWRGRERAMRQDGRWPAIITRELSHVKLVLAGGAVKAKLYLVASETFGLLI